MPNTVDARSAIGPESDDLTEVVAANFSGFDSLLQSATAGWAATDADDVAQRLEAWEVQLEKLQRDLWQREATVHALEGDLLARRRQLARDIRRHHRSDRNDGRSATAADEQRQQLAAEVETLKSENQSLRDQNDDLAGELAQIAMRQSLGDSNEWQATLSCEERKALLFQQLDSIDARSEPVNKATGDTDEAAELRRRLQERDREIEDLRLLLDQQSQVGNDELAVGALGIAKLLDSDGLVQEERVRLKELQAQWETKFRDLEIQSSIERATLARQRHELEQKNAELEEQIEHLKQELRQEQIAGPDQSRRWLHKLGLGD